MCMIATMSESAVDNAAQLDPSEDSAGLVAAAYERQTAQLHAARGALAETVHTLLTELEQRRQESSRLADDNATLSEHAKGLSEYAQGLSEELARLREEVRGLRERNEALEAELRIMSDLVTVFRNMKILRWTVWPRRMVYRLRMRGG